MLKFRLMVFIPKMTSYFQVQKVKDKAQGVADVIQADKAVAETKLEAAKPALQKAEAALQVVLYDLLRFSYSLVMYFALNC